MNRSGPGTVVAVIGGARERSDEILGAAERLGELLASEGWILLTGGGEGVMEAASAGARRAGGRVVGILPGSSRDAANAHVEIPLATGLGEARNAVIATAAAAAVALGGEYGTLSEIGHTLKLGKPVIALHSTWSELPGVIVVTTPEEAVQRLRDIL